MSLVSKARQTAGMPELIVITGPPASGKAAIGTALADLTGFRLFHNHMTGEPIAALFGWGTDEYNQVAMELRLFLFARALELQSPKGIIFTFVWAFNSESDHRFVADLVKLFDSRGRHVNFVELLAGQQTRIAREGTPLRLSLKPAHRDVQKARAMHADLDARYRMNSNGDFPYPHRHLVVDTERHSAHESAAIIQKHFDLPTVAR